MTGPVQVAGRAFASSRPGDWSWIRLLEPGLAAFAVLGLVVSRLVGLERYSGSYPEGIRAEQLLLMARGYQPFAEIFSNQGPWALQVMYPGYVLFGESLVGVRSSVVVASLLGLAGSAWVARQLAGPLAGLAALVLLGISPIYLQFSRLGVVEPLAVAPGVLAIGCAMRFQSTATRRWLVAAGVLLAASLLIKPITLGMAAPVGLAILLAPGRRGRHLLELALVTLGVGLLGMLLVGLPEIVRQILEFRMSSRQAEGWSLATNLKAIRVELAPEGAVLLGLAAIGALLAALDRRCWPLVAWLVGAAVTILAHAPLHSKHFMLVVVPLATLAAFGLARLVAGLRLRPKWLVVSAGLAGLLAVAVALPPLVAADGRILTSDDLFERDEARLWWGDAIETFRRVAGDDEHVLTDHTYLAWAASRQVPPGLVEASAVRVRAGSLDDAQAIDATERHGVRAVLLWADKLNELRGYRAWLTEHYAPAKLWAPEGETRPILWLRRDERLAEDRAALRAGLSPLEQPSRYRDWRLVSAGLSGPGAPRAGDRASVLLEWEPALVDPADGLVVLALRDSAGRVVEDESEPLLATSVRPAWLYWVGALRLPPGAAAGRYEVTAELRDLRNRRLGAPAVIGTLDVVGS